MLLKLASVSVVASLLLPCISCMTFTYHAPAPFGIQRANLHPLDPLTAEEFTATSRIINAHHSGDHIFNYVQLREPEKSILLPYFLSDTVPPPGTIPRKSFTILMDKGTGNAFEAVVNLDTEQVESWLQLPAELLPKIPYSAEELGRAEIIARLDANVIARSQRLGFTNMSMVNADCWSIGYVEDQPQYKGKRLAQLYLYGITNPLDNQYYHPFDFVPVVDLLEDRVIAIEELPLGNNHETRRKMPPRPSHDTPKHDHAAQKLDKSFRKLKPVKVSQDEGVNYNVSGNEITWQQYKMRIGFNGREGLIIYQMSYNDSDNVRSLFYRISIGEMFVPYGDPRPPYHRKHVFDEGQYGMGFTANSLKPGVDCIGEVSYVDAVLNDHNGQPISYPNVVCIRELDNGVLWKHTDPRTGHHQVVRDQQLHMTTVVTVGNYDYMFTWKFSMDGSIEYHVQLTGILSVNLLADGAGPEGHGSVIYPNLNAQYHQHFFSLRLDAEIDGTENSVTVTDTVPGPGVPGGGQNPYGQGWTTERTLLTTAGAGRARVAPEKARVWIISNPGTQNEYTGAQHAWKLMPYASAPLMMQPESPIHPLAAWMDYNTWVTPYKEDQIFPGGVYLNGSGLPEWVDQNPGANIENTDVVVWFNFGLSHVPRPEDFPIMPQEQISVFLKPYNFFKENPSIDVPQADRRMKTEL